MPCHGTGETAIELWDLATRHPLGVLQVKCEQREFGLVFSADGNALYTARAATQWKRRCKLTPTNPAYGWQRRLGTGDSLRTSR
jgi:hypothetical protein